MGFQKFLTLDSPDYSKAYLTDLKLIIIYILYNLKGKRSCFCSVKLIQNHRILKIIQKDTKLEI